MVGESWTWSIPVPSHEDNSTDDHTFNFKVKTDKPMDFLEYFESTNLLDISQNVTTSEDVGVYVVTISLKDEQNVASSEPLVLKITVQSSSGNVPFEDKKDEKVSTGVSSNET